MLACVFFVHLVPVITSAIKLLHGTPLTLGRNCDEIGATDKERKVCVWASWYGCRCGWVLVWSVNVGCERGCRYNLGVSADLHRLKINTHTHDVFS